jgi:hypothetical protein
MSSDAQQAPPTPLEVCRISQAREQADRATSYEWSWRPRGGHPQGRKGVELAVRTVLGRLRVRASTAQITECVRPLVPDVEWSQVLGVLEELRAQDSALTRQWHHAPGWVP